MNIVSPPSVCARGLRTSGVGTETDAASSESDSGTGSKCSFLIEQEQRPPWLQQQISATSMIRNCCWCAFQNPRKAYPVYYPHANKRLWSVPSHHTHNGHVPTYSFEGFGNGYIVKQGGPEVRHQHRSHTRLKQNLNYCTYLFIDVLQRPVGMLTIAHAVASYTGLACVFLSLD